MTHLDVNSGETYKIDSNDTEEWSSIGVESDPLQGTVELNGTIKLIDDADTPPQGSKGFPTGGGFDDGSGIDLPLEPLNLLNMSIGTGTSIFLVGLMSLLLSAAAALKNYIGGIFWSLALFALLASGLFNIGLELFWAMVAATSFVLAAGMFLRWSG